MAEYAFEPELVSAPNADLHDRLDERVKVAAAAPWRADLQRSLALSDAVVLLVTVVVSDVIKFGLVGNSLGTGYGTVSYITFGAAIALVWWVLLGASGSRSARILTGSSEPYRRIIRSTVFVFGLVAIASLLLKIDMSRGFLALQFPIGLAGLLLSRRLWARRIARQRAQGRLVSNVLLIGGTRSAQDVTRWLRGHRQAGFRTTGVWVPDLDTRSSGFLAVPDAFVPVLGNRHSLGDALRISEADTVIVTDTEHMGRHGLKKLVWQLEDADADLDLLLAPNVFDVAGSRIHLTECASMPLLGVDKPKYGEAAQWPKLAFDKIGAGFIVLMLSPILLATALAVKLSSRGPVFYHQERIGLNGEPFGMMKFRSMRVGADRELQALVAAQGLSLSELPKLKKDPRVTPVGAFIRRFSIDELPQLLNVVKGDMSLVGPRPQRQFEVDNYDEVAHRRLRVRPGMTGLWQVSGRSDLSYEESIRLDTYYVENWSLTGDLQILWRTVRAVLASDGAY